MQRPANERSRNATARSRASSASFRARESSGIACLDTTAAPAAQNVRDVSASVRNLVGRDDELEAVVRLLDAPERLPGAVVLAGEAGIGKTTLWLAGVEAAVARGYRVLTSRPSEAEAQFAFACVGDLLGDVAGSVLAELPPI